MSLIIDALKKAQQLRSKESKKTPFFKSQGYHSRGLKTGRWMIMGVLFAGLLILLVIFIRFLLVPPVSPPEQTAKLVERQPFVPVSETVSPEIVKGVEKPEPIIEPKPSPPKIQKEDRGTTEKKSEEKILIKPTPEEGLMKGAGDQEKVAVEKKTSPPSHSLPPKEEVSSQPITFKQEGGKERISHSEATNQFNLGVSYYHQGEIAKAIQAYSKAIEMDPVYIEAFNNLGMTYQEMGDLENALRSYRRAIEINPKYEKALNNIGILFFLRGEDEKALETFLKLLAINPNHIESHIHLGMLYKKKGQPEKGIESYQKALAINPLHGEAHYNLGLLYEQMEKTDLAVYHYQQFIQLSSNSYPDLASKVKRHVNQLMKTKDVKKK